MEEEKIAQTEPVQEREQAHQHAPVRRKRKRVKNISTYVGISLLTAIVVVLVAGGLLYANRNSIIQLLATDYIAANKNNMASSVPLTQESLVEDAVKQANPAVVSITISENVPTYKTTYVPSPLGQLFPGGDPFGLNLQIPEQEQDGTQNEVIGGGTGFFVSSDGLIVTNKHVVDDTNATYSVLTNDGKKYPATILALDNTFDIAVIKITPAAGQTFPSLTLGDSSTLQLGQSVIAIGNVLAEFHNSVSVGVVSGLSRNIVAGDDTGDMSETLDQVIQTDAAINPGNSGGPLLNLEGQVIGVNVALAEGSQSIGFALPINLVKSAIQSVEQTGKIVWPYLGVRYEPVTDDLQTTDNLSVDYGALVESDTKDPAVIPGSPADKAGIVSGDIILEVNGTKVDQDNDLAYLIREYKVGDTITLLVLHKGAQETLSVTLAAGPASTS